MNLAEFFESQTVELPIGGFLEGKQTFDAFLTQVFHRYMSDIELLNDPDFSDICSRIRRSLPAIEVLCNQIVLATKHYLKGYPHQAYVEIEKSLSNLTIEDLISNLSGFVRPDPPQMSDNFLESTLHPPLYRMRSDRAAAASGVLSRKNIFHVPFEDRRRVGNQRYSIAGLPCLYLGSSLWICWQELGRPDLDSVFVSRFRLAESIRVLDFQLPPNLAWKMHAYVHASSKTATPTPFLGELLARYSSSFVTSYASCWPLIAACSVKTQGGDGSFFPQYIVPQLLLQWVSRERKVDGIRYFSTRVPPTDYFAHINCVFPAKEIRRSGRCSYLKRKFALTVPLAWEILRALEPPRFVSGPGNSSALIRLTEDHSVEYRTTSFFKAEATLEMIEGWTDASKQVED